MNSIFTRHGERKGANDGELEILMKPVSRAPCWRSSSNHLQLIWIFSLDHFLLDSRSCVPSSLIVFDLPALPRDPSGPSDHVAYLRSSTAPDSHLSPPGGSIPPENLTSDHAPL
ncbi:hypothetical protein AMECASPLE_026210 [Ameca splendens]|uniref:Uncharacterized protein n=1 Tax=Ameca splendens TaxID=208324 RepID=A0ABV1A159_9TELE